MHLESEVTVLFTVIFGGLYSMQHGPSIVEYQQHCTCWVIYIYRERERTERTTFAESLRYSEIVIWRDLTLLQSISIQSIKTSPCRTLM